MALLALLEHLLLQTPLQAVLAAPVEVPLSIYFKRPVVHLVKAEARQHQVLRLEELHGFTEQAPLEILQVEAARERLAQA